MVNEHQGKEYEPEKVYCRRMARTIVRNQMIRRNGYHNVSASLHAWWEKSHENTVRPEKKKRKLFGGRK